MCVCVHNWITQSCHVISKDPPTRTRTYTSRHGLVHKGSMVKRIAVLGGGISGLAAAWNLARKGLASMGGHGQLEVTLFEASNRVGGWIRSERSKEGAVFELGPRSLRTVGIPGKTSLEVV